MIDKQTDDVHVYIQGTVPVKGAPIIGWDPTGLAISIACTEGKTVGLYDPGNLSQVRCTSVSL